MGKKTFVYIGAFIGGIIGSFVPSIWGSGFLSFSSIFFSGVFGLIGIFIALKLIN